MLPWLKRLWHGLWHKPAKSGLTRANAPWRAAIPAEIVPRLRALQRSQRKDWWPPWVLAEDALLLDPGMGPVLYLTFDGRVLEDRDGWDEEGGCFEVTDPKDAWMSLIVGAKKQGAPELLRLLPTRPNGAAECTSCAGTGRWPPPMTFLCEHCGGLGWRQ
jgi:hypothetical protein